jgi:hypothetical protein
MKIGRTLLAVSLLGISIAPAAHAGSKIMASGPAARYYPLTQAMHCNIVNLHDEAKPVTIDALDYSGTVVTTSGPLVLAPSTAATLLASGDFDQAAMCRFTVDGSTKKYRAVATYNDGAQYTTVHAAP